MRIAAIRSCARGSSACWPAMRKRVHRCPARRKPWPPPWTGPCRRRGIPASALVPSPWWPPLGQGGFATVYRAGRDNAGVRQEVALKLLHRGLHSTHARRQFQRERLALVQLRHPGIAHLIEAGVTEDGLAWIA